jgi:RNA 2',3'-cyclic 3'-phosphodiesterase
VRLFVALDLPAAVRAELVAWRADALAGRDDLRPVAAEALHVTLVFLGYRYEKDVARIWSAARDAMSECSAPALGARDVVPVPPRGSPRLFALDLDDGAGQCSALQSAASAALAAARLYEPEKRPFWPHVTFARVKRGVRRAAGIDAADPPAEPFQATDVVLYRSHLSPRGARYEALERFGLK